MYLFMSLGLGAGSELRSPMAIAVIGGLATSTLLTLVVVPVIFTYIDSLQARLARTIFRRAVERRVEDGTIDSQLISSTEESLPGRNRR